MKATKNCGVNTERNDQYDGSFHDSLKETCTEQTKVTTEEKKTVKLGTHHFEAEGSWDLVDRDKHDLF